MSAEAPDRSPPHSAEAEEHVLSCCLVDGADTGPDGRLTYPTLTRALEASVTPESFYFPANRLIFEVCCALRTAEKPVMIETLGGELTARRQLEAAGGYAYLTQVSGRASSTAHAGYFIETVRDKAARREFIRLATGLVEQSYNGETLADLTRQAESLIAPVVARVSDRHARLSSLQSRRVSATAKPAEPVVRLYLADKPICTPGNITTLTSKAKTGKTATTGAAVAAIIAASAGTGQLADTFRFRATNPEGHAVLIFDTEQSPYDAWTCYERALLRSASPQEPKWLYHYALVGFTPRQLHDALDLAIAEAKRVHGGVFAVILDGVADFVQSVNDEVESNAFVTWLRERTVTHDCPAICVIHSNEGEKSGDDGRGHLGKQLIRKAESNLLLKKEGEVTTITSDKQRKAPITAQDNVAFQWSDQQGRHVSTDAIEPRKAGGRKPVHTITDFWECVPEKSEPPQSGTQIHRKANTLHETKANTFKSMLEAAWRDGVLERTYDKVAGYLYRKSV